MAPMGIVITLLLAVAGESGVMARAVLEPPVVPFHRNVRYTIEVEAPEDTAVTLPDALTSVEGLEIKADTPTDESIGRGRRRLTKTFVLDPIQTGDYLIPAMNIRYGDAQELTLPPFSFRARELTPEELEAVARFEAITGPDALLRRGVSPIWFALGAVCIAALLAAAWAYYRMRRNAADMAPPPPPPWETALRRLDELELRRLPELGRFDAYYVDLSAILRYYIEDRFGLHTPEQTTPQFLEDASRSGVLRADQQVFLADFLRHCDRVKFARYVPEAQEMQDGMSRVRQFVLDTIPKPEEGAVQGPEMVPASGGEKGSVSEEEQADARMREPAQAEACTPEPAQAEACTPEPAQAEACTPEPAQAEVWMPEGEEEPR